MFPSRKHWSHLQLIATIDIETIKAQALLSGLHREKKAVLRKQGSPCPKNKKAASENNYYLLIIVHHLKTIFIPVGSGKKVASLRFTWNGTTVEKVFWTRQSSTAAIFSFLEIKHLCTIMYFILVISQGTTRVKDFTMDKKDKLPRVLHLLSYKQQNKQISYRKDMGRWLA